MSTEDLKQGHHGIVKVLLVDSELMARKICLISENSLAEAKILEFLQGHPNIVRVTQVEITPTTVETTMDYIPQTLLDLISSFPDGLPPERLFYIFYQILSAVKYMHTKGVVHKDLKLENILVDRADRIVVIDFGFSRFFLPGQQSLLDGNGSLHYASPEIWHRLPYEGPEVDVWALGVILYVLATGYFPFGGTTSAEIFQNLESEDLWFPPELDSQPVLRHAISELLEYDYQKRTRVDGILKHPWIVSQAASNPLLGMSSSADKLKALKQNIPQHVPSVGPLQFDLSSSLHSGDLLSMTPRVSPTPRSAACSSPRASIKVIEKDPSQPSTSILSRKPKSRRFSNFLKGLRKKT